jgi:hypothetical protein
MKKIICFIMTAALILSPTSIALAKQGNAAKHNDKGRKTQITLQQEKKTREKEKVKHQDKHSKGNKQEFKIYGSPVIQYGRIKLPIAPITKGMGATVKFDQATAVLTVTKGTITIVIDFKNKKVTVNGVEDMKSGIFTAKNDHKTTVLIKYIAKVLGVRVEVDDDEVIVEVPGLNNPTKVTVTPVGSSVLPNTLNSTTLYMTASANITAGQATGGRAELYVGSKLVATDSVIAATDTTVNFTTSDETPATAELMTAIPAGGVVTVKLYNAANQAVVSKTANPTLVVDYAAPTLTSITSASFSESGLSLYLNVTGAGAVGDKVDVSKIFVYNATLGVSYQLTSAARTGSTGVVSTANLLTIQLGSADALALTGFKGSNLMLNIAPGSLLKDAAGNTSASTTSYISVPVAVVVTALNPPTNVTVTPVGTSVLPNTLNSTTLYMTAAANITAGQATGGKAELYVGSKLVATDAVIAATDTTVNFTTADETPATSELMTAVPAGGVVTVKLYNAANQAVVSNTANPTLVVDYAAPTLTGVTSGIYSVSGSSIYLNVTGAGAVGDIVDVTKLVLYNTTLGVSYQLTGAAGTGSTGVVSTANMLTIKLGSADALALTGFKGSPLLLNVLPGSLLKDAAGNTSATTTTTVTVPVTVFQ